MSLPSIRSKILMDPVLLLLQICINKMSGFDTKVVLLFLKVWDA